MSQLRVTTCRTCKKTVTSHVSRKVKYCSRACWFKSLKGLIPKNIISGILWTDARNERRRIKTRGEKSHNWKGDDVGYQGIHRWLCKEYPKSGKCESCGKIKRTQWALKSGKKHKRRRELYKELCSKCHIKYDNITKRGWKTKRTKALR